MSDKIIQAYKNLKEKKEMKLFKFIMPKKNEGEDKKEPEKMNADEAMVDINGAQVPLSEIIGVYLDEQAEMARTAELEKQQADAQPVSLKPEDKAVVDGKEVLVSELIACYERAQSKINETEDDDKKENQTEDEDKKKDEEKQNAVKADEKKKKENFDKIKSAMQKENEGVSIDIMTDEKRYSIGKERYGSKEAK